MTLHTLVEILGKHQPIGIGRRSRCACGWQWALGLDFATHQAEEVTSALPQMSEQWADYCGELDRVLNTDIFCNDSYPEPSASKDDAVNVFNALRSRGVKDMRLLRRDTYHGPWVEVQP